MRYEFFISLRYLKTKKANSFISRISVIGVCIVALAIMIPLLTMSVMNGFHESVKEKHINKDFHVLLKKSRFYNPEEIISELLAISGLKKKIKSIVPFYRGKALLKYQDSRYFGVLIQGIQEGYYKNDKSFNKHFPLIAGKFEEKKKFRVVIGDKLVQFLNPNRKDYLQFVKNITRGVEPTIEVLIFKGKEGFKLGEDKITTFKLKVSGIFKSGYLEYDRDLAFMSLTTAQILFNAKIKRKNIHYKIVTGLGIKLHNRNDADDTQSRTMYYNDMSNGGSGNSLYCLGIKLDNLNEAKKCQEIVEMKYDDIYIYTWKGSNRNLLNAFKWEKTLMDIVLAIMILASVVITIYINLNIVVMDKKREIGILRSFGVTNRTIRTIFIVEGFLIGLVGTLLGSILGILLITSLPDIIMYVESFVNHVLIAVHSVAIDKKTPFVPWEFLSGGLSHLKVSLYKVSPLDLYGLCALSLFWSMLGAYLPARKSTLENISTVIRYE